MDPRIDPETGLFRGQCAAVEAKAHPSSPFGDECYAILWCGHTIIAFFRTKEVANGVAATFDALAPEGRPMREPPYEALLELVGFRQVLSEVVVREAHRLAEQEAATRAAGARLRGRTWP